MVNGKAAATGILAAGIGGKPAIFGALLQRYIHDGAAPGADYLLSDCLDCGCIVACVAALFRRQ